MEHKSFYRIFKDEGLPFGWKTAKRDILFFLQVFAIIGIANAIPMIINLITNQPHDKENIGDFIAMILSLIFGFGLIKIMLHYVHEKKRDLKDLFDHDWIRFLWWVLTRVVCGILIGLGFILLIIPGIYVAARFYLVEYFVVDQKMNTLEAIGASWETTKGHVRQIIGIWLLSFGIILLGVLALLVGLLWAIPTVKLAQATLYKKLTSRDHHLE